MHFAELAEDGRTQAQHRRAAGMVIAGCLGEDLQIVDWHTEGREDGKGIGLDIIGIDHAGLGFPVAWPCKAHTNAGRRQDLTLLGLVVIGRPDFEQGDITEATRGIAPGGLQQIAEDRGPHGIEIGADRVVELDEAIGAGEEGGDVARHEAEGDGLGETTTGQQALGQMHALLAGSERRHRQSGRLRQGGHRDIVEVVDPQDLLDDIRLAIDIMAPAGNGNRPLGGRGFRDSEAELFQHGLLGCRGDINTAQTQDTGRTEIDRALPVRHGAGLGRMACFATADLQDQAGADLDAGLDRLRIDATFKAIAGIGIDVELATGAGNCRRLEQGGFEEDIDGRFRAAGAFATHDAADREGAAVISDHCHAAIERVGLAVERQHLFALFGEAHGEITLHLIGIEDMQRAAEIEGDKIGDIDQRRDRPQTDRDQAILQPFRTGAVLDTLYITTSSQRAILPVLCQMPFHRALERAGNLAGFQRLQRADADRFEIAGNATDAEAIGTVRRQFDLDHRIIEFLIGSETDTERRVIGQFDDPVMIRPDAHFTHRAEHAVGFDTANDSGFQIDAGAGNMAAGRCKNTFHSRPGIRRTADHLDDALAGIDHADAELVGIGMLLGRDHIGNGERCQFLRAIADPLDLEAEPGQLAGDSVEIGSGLKMFLEPGQREFHRVSPPTSDGTSSAWKP